MLYHFYEWNHAALAPLRAVADATRLFYQNPLNPMSSTQAGRTIAAMAEVFERSTRVYGKPEFGILETVVGGLRVPVADKPVWRKPFARLLHFERALPASRKPDPRILIVAPMSGHYATLLRGTVEALLPYADVYITDWTDARTVPVTDGKFDLDDYVDYVIEMLHVLGPDTHVIGVCQPAVPVLMAVARMEIEDDPCAPATMTLMGGPIDTRINPTGVNKLAEDKGIDWFRDHVIMKVPFPQPGFMREVYPGFLQLSGFMSMNLDRHVTAHKEFYGHLVKNDGDSAEKHRDFYDEYMAVMDLTAEFYLQTVDNVFIKHALPKGEMMHRGLRIDLTQIKRTALLTVEGENDDISGAGQTKAAQTLCSSIPEDKRVHYTQPKVGHYGVFNGSRFRAEIAPRIVDFALTHGTTHGTAKRPASTAAGPAVGVAVAAADGPAGVEAVLAAADATPAAGIVEGFAPAAAEHATVASCETPAVAVSHPAAPFGAVALASNENVPPTMDVPGVDVAVPEPVHEATAELMAGVASLALTSEICDAEIALDAAPLNAAARPKSSAPRSPRRTPRRG